MQVSTLFADDREQVRVERWDADSRIFVNTDKGAEILVLDGGFTEGNDELKSLRDFFLIMFFFTVGATFDLHMGKEVFIPALVLALLILSVKPLVFSFLLRRSHEDPKVATEIGVRLGQSSEFSLLIAVLALELGIVSHNAAYLIQVSTIITFIVSSYLIVLKYPTPMAVSDKLRRD